MANKKSNRVVLMDVAAEAGVSVTMVSRYVTKSGYVSDDSAKIIEAAIEKLGFVPRIPKKRKNLIGLVVPEGDAAYAQLVVGRILQGVGGWCRERKNQLTIICAPEAELPAALENTLHLLDGVLLLDVALSDAVRDVLTESRKPYVMINEPSGADETPSILIDNRTGGRLAVEHLVKFGHSKIMLLNGNRGTHTGLDRNTGAAWAAESANCKIPMRWDVDCDWNPNSARKAVRRVFGADNKDRPTAIAAASDVMAVAAIDELRNLGLSVPKDVSVVGFDDSIIAPLVTPALTSIRQPLEDMGRRAAETLFAMVARRKRYEAVDSVLPVTLAKRDTVAAPKG